MTEMKFGTYDENNPVSKAMTWWSVNNSTHVFFDEWMRDIYNLDHKYYSHRQGLRESHNVISGNKNDITLFLLRWS